MNKIIPLLLLLPLPGLSAPSVQILSPLEGDCVNNGEAPLELFPGAERESFPQDLSLELELNDPDGEAIDLEIRVDGELLREEVFILEAGPQHVEIGIWGDSIDDGQNKLISVMVSNERGSSEASVLIDLDREPPRVSFSEESVALLNTCFSGEAEALQYEVEDERELDSSELVEDRDGCRYLRKVESIDSCGNESIYIHEMHRAPPQAPEMEIRVQDHDGQLVSDGDRAISAQVFFEALGEAGCAETQGNYTVDGGEVRNLLYGGEFRDPGRYHLEFSLSACEFEDQLFEQEFILVGPVEADAGGPYFSTRSEALRLSAALSNAPPEYGQIEYSWDLDNDGRFDDAIGIEVDFDTNQSDGNYIVGLRLSTETGENHFTFTEITIGDVTPTCELTGMESITQGIPAIFHATAEPGSPAEPILVYRWDFGDDRFPQAGFSLTEVSHRYESEGIFRITLRVEDEDSVCESSVEIEVNDANPNIQGMGPLEAELLEGEEIQLSAGFTSPGSPYEPITNYRWDFGDGSPIESGPELILATHSYMDDGPYELCLWVEDQDGENNQCLEIEIQDLNPHAVLDGPRFAVEGREVRFSAEGSRAGGAGDLLSALVWDFGDGSPELRVEPGTFEVSHIFSFDARGCEGCEREEVGDLEVRLRVEDEDSSDLAIQTIRVADASPSADVILNPENPLRPLFEGLPVVLDASMSTAGSPGDPITTYRWDFGDGELLEGPDLERLEHTWFDEGVYVVQLTLFDSDGSPASREIFIEVFNQAPEEVEIIAQEDQMEIGRSSTWRVSYRDVPTDIARITWYMGDGTIYENRDSVEHAYASMGTFIIRVSVDDGDGGVSEVRRELLVTSAGPRILVDELIIGLEDQPLSFDFEVLSPPNSRGGFDGPALVELPILPRGLSWRELDVEDASQAQRFQVEWLPGLASAGDYRLRIEASSRFGIKRSREIKIEIEEGGQLYLASLYGGADEARLSLFQYNFDNLRRRDEFEMLLDLSLGLGLGELASLNGQIFTSLPFSSAVAVIRGEGTEFHLSRKIPVLGTPFALLEARGKLWAFDVGLGYVSVIDPRTLKVTVESRLPAPIQAALKIPGRFTGDENANIVALSTTGELFLLDPGALLLDEDPIKARFSLGTRPDHLVMDEEQGLLYISDARERKLWVFDRLMDGPDAYLVEYDLQFAIRDMAVQGGDLWLVSDEGLLKLSEERLNLVKRGALRAIDSIPNQLFGLPGLILGGKDRLLHLITQGDSLAETLSIRSSGAERFLFFQAP